MRACALLTLLAASAAFRPSDDGLDGGGGVAKCVRVTAAVVEAVARRRSQLEELSARRNTAVKAN